MSLMGLGVGKTISFRLRTEAKGSIGHTFMVCIQLCYSGDLSQGPMHLIIRDNPFPEVTDLFCRLPLSTLFYQLGETALLVCWVSSLFALWTLFSISAGFDKESFVLDLNSIDPYLTRRR